MKQIITFLFLCTGLAGLSQTEPDFWIETDTISTEFYEFQVPTAWRNLDNLLTSGNGPEQYFEANGKGLPISFNNAPVRVTVFLVQLEAKSLKTARQGVVSGYFQNPDRVFHNENDYSEKKLKLADGREAVLLNTRFYRKSNGMNQCRYDLVTYSKEHKRAYMMTVSIQFADQSYDFESENDLPGFAERLFATFRWK